MIRDAIFPSFLGQLRGNPDARELLADLLELRNSSHARRRDFLNDLDRIKSRYLPVSRRSPTADYFLYVLKSCNLVHAEWEYKQKFPYLTCRPTNYLLDCTNNCQLGCGGCRHTADREYASINFMPVRPGVMTLLTILTQSWYQPARQHD